MIALDTNVLVRYLAQDDRVQSPKATDFIERLSEQDPGFISVVAMTETAWVLEHAYRLSPAKSLERSSVRCRPTLLSSRASRKYSPRWSGSRKDAALSPTPSSLRSAPKPAVPQP